MHGVGARILDEAVSVTRDAGCLHMRCNVKWDSPAGIALYRKCGFALTDITDDDGGEYFVVKPLQTAEERLTTACPKLCQSVSRSPSRLVGALRPKHLT